MISNRYIHYNHNADKKDFNLKWSKNIKVNLSRIDDLLLPKYLTKNKNKYSNWFDGY